MKSQINFLLTILTSTVVLLGGCTDLKDGLPLPVAPGVQVHLPSWVDTSAANTNFHGKFANAGVQSCLKCHGQDYNGGNSNVSCITCHQRTGGSIHGRGWVDNTSAKFHGKTIATKNWDMRPCQQCHGTTYAGGLVPVSCRTCHNQIGGPENCATCHGPVSSTSWPDLAGNTAKTFRGVGGHRIHFQGGSLAAVTMFCNDCHKVPGNTYDAGHVDTPGPAEVILSSSLASADPTVTSGPPTYRPDSLQCSNTFCHGNWTLDATSSPYPEYYTAAVMSGGNRPVRWTGGSAEAACGTCHGLPPAGHFNSSSIQRCGNCHIGIVGSDGRTIIDKSRHMNGKVDVFFDPSRSF